MPVWLIVQALASGLWKRLTALAGLARRYPWQTAVVALLLACGWLWHGKSQALRYASTEHTARMAREAAYVAAQKANEAKQAAQNADNANVQASTNRSTKDAQVAAQAARVDAVAAYAASHRLRPDAACVSAATAPGVPADPGKPDDPAAVPEMVAITRPDLDGLSASAVQGAILWRYLQAKVASGEAVVVNEGR